MEKKITEIHYANGVIVKKETNYDSQKAEERIRENEKLRQFMYEHPEKAEAIRAKLNKKTRNYNSLKRTIDSGMTLNGLKYFITLNCYKYRYLPKELLDVAKDFIKKFSDKYIIVLEAFNDGHKGYHIHALCDKRVDIHRWASTFGGKCITSNTFNSDGVFDCNTNNNDEIDFDNYCGEIYSSQEKCLRYISKKIPFTKARIGKYSHVYVCSTKRIDSKKIERIQDEEGKIYTIFDNVHKKRENNPPKVDNSLSKIDNNTDDLIHDTNLDDIVPQINEKGFIPKCKTATNTVFKGIKKKKYKLSVCTRIKSLLRKIHTKKIKKPLKTILVKEIVSSLKYP